MRDFHNQKDIFKAMLSYFKDSEDMPVNWRDGHVFTVDWFLWFMAAHGYTLQKSRKHCVDFHDLESTIQKSKLEESKRFAEMINTKTGGGTDD